MGIRHLNKYLKTNCNSPETIKRINARELSGKKIAVDISIYLYKFYAENTLIESMYLMLSIFRHYNIIPIFIFDGKPPAEKKELLIARRLEKQKSEQEYIALKEKLCDNNLDEDDKQEIANTMDVLKKKFVYITKDVIKSVKDLITAYGACYYDALGEADELCAMLVLKKKAYACLSEDMDMFVYGTTKVLRYMSLLNHSFVCYDMKNILEELKLSQREFREICVISGSDYTDGITKQNACNLHATLKYFNKYKKSNMNTTSNSCLTFYEWLLENTNYIEDDDYEDLLKICERFDIGDYSYNFKSFEKIKIVNMPVQKKDLHKILETDGFIIAVN